MPSRSRSRRSPNPPRKRHASCRRRCTTRRRGHPMPTCIRAGHAWSTTRPSSSPLPAPTRPRQAVVGMACPAGRHRTRRSAPRGRCGKRSTAGSRSGSRSRGTGRRPVSSPRSVLAEAVLLRGNLHAHTTYSDGVRTPRGLVAEYERLGYDFLAITDHFDHENLVHPDYDDTVAALESELLIFRGIELSYQRLDQHVGRVHGDTETLYILNHPARYKLTVQETLDRIAAIRRAGWPLEAMEITDTGLYRPLYDTDAIPLVKIATDDAHRPPHFGRAWIEVDARRDRDAIIRAIRAGDFRVAFARTS